MKVSISLKGDELGDPLQKMLEFICALAHLVISGSDEADLIIVDSSSEAIKMLRDNHEAVVVVAIIPGNEHDETAARLLRREYPKRVHIGQLFHIKRETDDVLLAMYISTFAKERSN